MIVIFGVIAVVAGSLLIGYSLGRRAVERRRIAKAMRIFELEADQSVGRAMDPVADQGNNPPIEPVSDHERSIAKAVDEKFQENPGNRKPTIRDYLDISASIDFVMSAEE